VLDDKDGDGMLAALGGVCASAVLTRPPGERGLPPSRLAPPPGLPTVIAEEPEHALEAALAAGSGLVVVCGSIYLLGAIRRLLHQRYGTPTPAAAVDVTGRAQAVS
jgi:dihydrofolate synthase/folylpolyglutamate synthase